MLFTPDLESLKKSTFFNVIYNDSFDMPMHSHQTYELMYVKNGMMQLIYKTNSDKKSDSDEVTLTLSTHQFVIINNNVRHKIIIPHNMTCNILNIELAPQYRNALEEYPTINEIILSTPKLRDCQSVQNFFSDYFPVAILEDDNQVEQTISDIHKAFSLDDNSNEVKYMCNLLISQLFLLISRCNCSHLNIAGNLYIRRTIFYIEQKYQSDISIDEIASYVQLNKAYLQRLVKKITSKTINTILQEYRIEKSKKFLVSTNKTVEEISEAVGYTNRQTFAKNFFKITGVCPQKYRQNNRNKYFRYYGGYVCPYEDND